jgi:hypothetical protein
MIRRSTDRLPVCRLELEGPAFSALPGGSHDPFGSNPLTLSGLNLFAFKIYARSRCGLPVIRQSSNSTSLFTSHPNVYASSAKIPVAVSVDGTILSLGAAL